LASYSDVEDVSFQITTSWTLKPEGKHRNSVSYTYDLDAYIGYGKLGGDDPLVEVSKQLKTCEMIGSKWPTAVGAPALKFLTVMTESGQRRKRVRRFVPSAKTIRKPTSVSGLQQKRRSFGPGV
jgi:hypothetical protein